MEIVLILIAVPILILLCLGLAILTASRLLVQRFTRPKLYSYQGILDYFSEKGLHPAPPQQDSNWKPLDLQSHDGLWLNAKKYQGSSEKIVLFVHGHSSNWVGMSKYYHYFQERNWTLFSYDQRYHGKSPGNFCSGGLLERKDLLQLIQQVRTEYPKAQIGLLGESMGGAIVLQELELNPAVDFCISLCPYSDLEVLFRYHLGRYRIRGFLQDLSIKLANGFFHKRTGGELSQVSPKSSLVHSKVPLLIIHGGNDDYVPTKMSREIYNARKDGTTLQIIPDATHAFSVAKNPELFWKSMEEFLAGL